jgi:ParB family chromosome partitioning protein
VDEALAYQRLADEFAMTQDQIAAAIGKDRTSVANYVRLLRLPEEVRGNLSSGALSMGHARALLALTDPAAQRQAARDVIARALSVRETEALVKKMAAPAADRAPAARPLRMSIPGLPKNACGSAWAQKSASSAAAKAGRSRLISSRNPS